MLSRIGVSSSLNFWQNLPVKPSLPALLFVGRAFIIVSISVFVMDLLRFSIPGLVLESYSFLGICPILPSFPFHCHIIAHSSLLWSFVCVVCLDFSIFIPNFIDLILLSFFFFFLMRLANGLSFYLSSQKTRFYVCYSFLSSPSFGFISVLMFMISFLPLTLWFLCFFSQLF